MRGRKGTVISKACELCGATFHPLASRQRFCSLICANRRRQRHPVARNTVGHPLQIKRLAYYRRHRAEKREWLEAFKGDHGCLKCGEMDHRCLQFHHRDPKTKIRTISAFYGGTWGIDVIQAEIEKCDVLCANCHIKYHRDEDAKRRAS